MVRSRRSARASSDRGRARAAPPPRDRVPLARSPTSSRRSATHPQLPGNRRLRQPLIQEMLQDHESLPSVHSRLPRPKETVREHQARSSTTQRAMSDEGCNSTGESAQSRIGDGRGHSSNAGGAVPRDAEHCQDLAVVRTNPRYPCRRGPGVAAVTPRALEALLQLQAARCWRPDHGRFADGRWRRPRLRGGRHPHFPPGFWGRASLLTAGCLAP